MQFNKGTLIDRNWDTEKIVCAVVIILCLPLLFFGDPSRFHFRLLPYIWDLGHIVLFATITWLILSIWSQLSAISDYKLLPVTLIIVVSVSIPIEMLQGFYDRENSFLDVMRNCVGASIAIAFRSRVFVERQLKTGVILKTLVSGLLLISVYPLIINSIDLVISYRSFPVLSDFESSLQLSRWHGNNLKIRQPESAKNRVLEALFTTEEYSTLNLNDFPGNWTGFSFLKFRVLNPDTLTRRLNLRINDKYHAGNNWDYHDRFNQELLLAPGWNNIVIDLNKVKVQPKYRNLDMSNIYKIALFSFNSGVERKYYFDDFVLGNRED